MTSPVDGFSIGRVAPPLAARHTPPMKTWSVEKGAAIHPPLLSPAIFCADRSPESGPDYRLCNKPFSARG
ncbi:hypothetical protein D3C77_355950 [compost metagenome]